MMDKTRDHRTTLFAAGGLTGLIGVTVLVLGLGVQDLAFGASATQPAVTAEDVPVAAISTTLPERSGVQTAALMAAAPAGTAAATGQMEQVLDQNEQLRQSLQLMLQREEAYRQQLDEARQAILTMQGAPMSDANGLAMSAGPTRSDAGAAQGWGEEVEHEYEHDGEYDDD